MTRLIVPSHGDSAIRLAGVGLVAIGCLAGRQLYVAAGTAGGHAPTPLDLLWGALAFLGMTTGAIFACLGRHIHDEVQISERWRPRLPAHVPVDGRRQGGELPPASCRHPHRAR